MRINDLSPLKPIFQKKKRESKGANFGFSLHSSEFRTKFPGKKKTLSILDITILKNYSKSEELGF